MALKIAMSTYSMFGAWFVLRLLEEGHKVDTYLSEPEFANVLGGIIPKPIILPGKRAYKNIKYDKYDLSLFDLTGAERQAEFSAERCPTIGDGAFNCAAEAPDFFSSSGCVTSPAVFDRCRNASNSSICLGARPQLFNSSLSCSSSWYCGLSNT